MTSETSVREMYPVSEARHRLGGLSNTAFYELVKAGRLNVVKLGRRTFVTAGEIQRFVESLGRDDDGR